MRLNGRRETEDGRPIENELRRQILTLWQTALIRLSRLKVADEIESGLRYYPASFFEVIPKVNAAVRDALRSRWPEADLLTRPIVRPDRGSAVTVTAIPTSPPRSWSWRRAAPRETALVYYFDELAMLERELSMSARLVHTDDALTDLASGCTEAARPTSRTAARCGSCGAG